MIKLAKDDSAKAETAWLVVHKVIKLGNCDAASSCAYLAGPFELHHEGWTTESWTCVSVHLNKPQIQPQADINQRAPTSKPVYTGLSQGGFQWSRTQASQSCNCSCSSSRLGGDPHLTSAESRRTWPFRPHPFWRTPAPSPTLLPGTQAATEKCGHPAGGHMKRPQGAKGPWHWRRQPPQPMFQLPPRPPQLQEVSGGTIRTTCCTLGVR